MIKKENYFWKTSEQLLKIYKVILITLFFTSPSFAELVKPNNGIEPYQVVKIQLRSLKQNDNPKKDNDSLSYDKRSFNHSGMEMYGNYDGEGPMWIRPQALRRNMLNDNIIQIVGHTHMEVIDYDDNHYFIDALPYEYMTIENGVPVIYEL